MEEIITSTQAFDRYGVEKACEVRAYLRDYSNRISEGNIYFDVEDLGGGLLKIICDPS